MTSFAALLLLLAALPLLFTSMTGYWAVACVAVVMLLVSKYSLQRAPKLRFEGLSPEAAELLARYNHAWSSPAMTKVARLAVTLWMMLTIGAALKFGIQGEWLSLGASVVLVLVLAEVSAFVDPTAYIRFNGLGQAHDEVLNACLDRAGVPRDWARQLSKHGRDDHPSQQ